jgi:hypothetical protein
MSEALKEQGENITFTRGQFEAVVVQKAWKDPEYKKRLLSSPKAVIEEELNKIKPGAKLPEDLQFYVHEETPNALHISLPVPPKSAAEEDWLKDAAGGYKREILL